MREVEPSRDRERLLVVAEAAAEALAQRLVERLLAGVAERRVAHVVPEPDRLGRGPRSAAAHARRRARSPVVSSVWVMRVR